jgi:hypothetical protein
MINWFLTIILLYYKFKMHTKIITFDLGACS